MKYRVEDFGAIGDGIADDSSAINEAIKKSSNEQAILVFSENKTYRAGLINILSNTHLYFEKNSILKASDELNKFKIDNKDIKVLDVPTYDNCDYNGNPSMYFIVAKDKNNITIEGEGIIDGNEEIFYGKISEHHIDGFFYPRVPLIFFENCKNIFFNNITLRKSGFWTVHLVGSENINIKDVNILNNMILANCDGIDLDHSKNVLIDGCHIEGADDSIVFKTTEAFKKYGDCKNIEVKNCKLSSTSAAVKCGTETTGNISDIYVHDSIIFNSNRGISFQLRDEGNIKNIKFENIDIETKRSSDIYWWGKAEGIAITAVRRYENTKIGIIDNIKFNNINIDGERGIFIYGENNISNIELNNINVSLKRKTDYDLTLYDLRPTFENKTFNDELSYAYIKNASNISLNNYTFKSDEYINNSIKKDIIIDNVNNFLKK